MYESFMFTLRTFFGYGSTRITLMGALAVALICLAAWTSPAFRAVIARLQIHDGWRGSLGGLAVGAFKILLIVLLARLCMVTLMRQADQFGHEHGRVTSDNRSAVLMKWGYPHEQSELSASFTRARTRVTRQLQLEEKDKEPRVFSEEFWKDETPPVQAIGGRLPAIISTREEPRDIEVPQRALAAADIRVHLRNNPRRLGNANYAGYEDTWSLSYTVVNRSPWDTTAHFVFPLPAETGLFDAMTIQTDGRDLADATAAENSAVTWDLPMPAGASNTVSIAYRSRGLEHLRYIPQSMTQTGRYRVAITLDGIPPEKLGYPIGSLPPAESLAAITTMPYTLTWNLDNALTSYDIGIKLPAADQPDYYFTQLLAEAPIGAFFLLALLTLPRLILGQRVRPDVILLLLTLYVLHYTFMGRLADVLPGFPAPFAISTIITALAAIAFRAPDRRDIPFLRAHEPAAFTVMTVLYPLMIIDAPHTALWLQILTLTTLLYLGTLAVIAWRSAPRNT